MSARAATTLRDDEASALVRAAIDEGISLRTRVGAELTETIVAAADLIATALAAGRTMLLCGNGGSAADCQHLASELTGRFGPETRRALRAVALTTDTSALTAIANDFGFEYVFARQVEALARPGDVLLAISTSGRSPNVVLAAQTARAMGASVVAMTGPEPGPLATCADLVMAVPGGGTARIQELHLTIGHIMCDLIERSCAAVPRLPAPSAPRLRSTLRPHRGPGQDR